MEYKDFGNTNIKVSRLGFGAMRLPHKGEAKDYKLLFDESIELMEEAIQAGINYIDTAYPYCHGQSEKAVGKVLKNTKRRVYISSKSPLWLIKKSDDFNRYLEESLDKLGLDCIDFYHFHSLSESFYEEKVLKLGLVDMAFKAKQQGLIKHLSFSFHDKPEILKRFVDMDIFDSVLCQYNFLDRTNKQAIAYARKKGLGVAIMGPLAGGRIFDAVAGRSIRPERLAGLALRFVLSDDNVSLAISGMENKRVLKKNIKVLEDLKDLDYSENALLDEIFSQKNTKEMISCNDCGYCIECPADIAIAEIFKIYNYYQMTDLLGNSRFQYKKIPLISGRNIAAECTDCGECEEKCPQDISIRDRLKEIDELFAD